MLAESWLGGRLERLLSASQRGVSMELLWSCGRRSKTMRLSSIKYRHAVQPAVT